MYITFKVDKLYFRNACTYMYVTNYKEIQESDYLWREEGCMIRKEPMRHFWGARGLNSGLQRLLDWSSTA
jgi:hypothetical protein